jgi:hypothetical protein
VGTSLVPSRVATNCSVVANAVGIFVIIVVDARVNTEAITKMVAADNAFLVFMP